MIVCKMSSWINLCVKDDKMHSELNCSTRRNQVRDARLNQDIRVFLTRIVITKDDISRCFERMPGCQIFVDIYKLKTKKT